MTTYLQKDVYEKLVGKSIDIKTNKYKNKKRFVGSELFDSQKEYYTFIKLQLMEKAGEIHELRRQEKFVLIEPFTLGNKKYRETSYISDFTYRDKEDKLHVIDVKSEITKTQVYKLKKKLMAYKYGIEIEEV